jgi:DNA-binding transcriptional ArsR family regulator
MVQGLLAQWIVLLTIVRRLPVTPRVAFAEYLGALVGQNVTTRPHQLEKLFGLGATEILDVVLRNNRTLMNLKGAVAQEHLRRHLKQLVQEGKIDSFESIDQEGKPDFKVRYRNRDFLIECRQVREVRKSGEITVDFIRTRYPIRKPWLQWYSPDELEILAVCTFNQTRQWKFRFIPTKFLPHHPQVTGRVNESVSLEPSQEYFKYWTADLEAALRQLV